MAKKKYIETAVASIDAEIEHLIDLILKTLTLPSAQMIEETRVLLKHEVNMMKESFLRGYELVLNYAALEKFHLPKEHFELKTVNKGEKHKNKILQEILGYTPRMMREIYEFGCNLYHQKEFAKCIDIFNFLNILNPTVCWFWQVLGRAWEEQEKHQEARYAYCVAINCDLHRIEGYQDAVRCCIKTKDFASAHRILDYGLHVVKIDPSDKQNKSLEAGLKAMKAYIKKIGG